MYVDLQKRESSSSSSYQSQSNSEVESILNTILPPKGWIFGSFFYHPSAPSWPEAYLQRTSNCQFFIFLIFGQSLRRTGWCGGRKLAPRRPSGGTWRLWGEMTVIWIFHLHHFWAVNQIISLLDCFFSLRYEITHNSQVWVRPAAVLKTGKGFRNLSGDLLFHKVTNQKDRTNYVMLFLVRCGGSCTPSARTSWSGRPPSPAWSVGCCC